MRVIEEKADLDKIGGVRGAWKRSQKIPEKNQTAVFDYCIKITEEAALKVEEEY